MRELLFLCHRIPYPPDKGDKIRALHLLEHLAASFAIHLGCLADDPADLAHLSELRARTASLACFPLDRRRARLRSAASLGGGRPLSLGYFHDRRLAAWVGETLQRRPIAQLFVFCSAMAPYVMKVPRLPRILDMVDMDSQKFAAYAEQARLPMRFVFAREARTLFAFERQCVRHFDRTLFVSPAEEKRFLALAPECAGRTEWVENGVDLEHFAPGESFASPFAGPEPAIVFTGTMDYRPNIEAVRWFADTVLPRLALRSPPPSFHIVGARPTAQVQALAARPGVHVSGRVPDTRPYLAHAALVVAPLRIGRGIQNKVLEAMAMGRPVLATPAALEGIRATPGGDVLVAKSEDEMAHVAAAVLDGQYPGLGGAARRAVAHGHDWQSTLARLDALIDLPPRMPARLLGVPA